MFQALLLTQADRHTTATLTSLDDAALPAGNVDVRVEYSSLNFKDALAITGRGAIVKQWPLVPRIDLAGVVERSDDAAWPVGERVVVNGWGLGETHWGGLAQRARLSSAWLLKLPAAYSTQEAMAIGTAGYTAALCVMALQTECWVGVVDSVGSHTLANATAVHPECPARTGLGPACCAPVEREAGADVARDRPQRGHCRIAPIAGWPAARPHRRQRQPMSTP